MDYFNFIISVTAYVEKRLKTEIDYTDIEKVTGFSFAHIRAVFRERTKISFARYILYRRISNAAFDIIHSDKNILDIALEYGFDSYDTFTRAFKRFTSITPMEFRKKRIEVGRIKLAGGMFGPGILNGNNAVPRLPEISEVNSMKDIKKLEDSCILYGVPKVKYCYEECTPFPSALRACLNYMGQDINYGYIMAASGAAFRLRWNTNFWDGGNVDIMYIYENPTECFERSFKAAGRSYDILERRVGKTKKDFIQFIKSEIDNGRPVIALGIIGPPEACIVTGYRDNGETLLGWNFFQDNPGFAKDTEIDECGYFICKNWWENPETKAVISIGEEKGVTTSLKDILLNAIDILTKERVGECTGGQEAYDAWAKSLSDESQFPKDAVMPMLFERVMCQNDAMCMIGEGRAYAGFFMEWAAKQDEKIKDKCMEAARCFKEEWKLSGKMNEQMGRGEHGEEQARNFAKPPVRKEIAKLIMEAKNLDLRACNALKEIVKNII